VALNLGPSEEVVFEGHPSWRAILSFYFQGLLAIFAIAAIAGVVTAIGDGLSGSLVGAIVGIGVVALVLAGFIKRIATVYTITNQRLRISRGFVARKVQEARLERVQNVNYGQGLIDRVFNVGTVDFDTAGTDDAEFRFAWVADPEQVVRAVHTAMDGEER